MTRGSTIWSSWALTLASCAVGCVLVAVIVWSFPGPPIGLAAVALALLLIASAGRLNVRIETDGLSVPRGLGQATIRRADVTGLSIGSESGLGATATTSTVTAHMTDGSRRPIWLLTSFNARSGGQTWLQKVAEHLARSLGLPLT